MPKKTVGQAAYEAYQARIVQPPWWPWDALPESAKQGWEEIAVAAIEQYALNVNGRVSE